MRTAKEFANAKPKDRPYKLHDAGGLFMLVTPAGGRYWRYKYRVDGREKLLALGTADDKTLAEARAARDSARELVKAGHDPVQQKRVARLKNQEAQADTFEQLAREWVAKKGGAWSAVYRDRIVTLLESNLFPVIGALPVRQVDAQVLLGALRPVEARGSLEILARLRQWSGMVLRYGIATGRADRDWSVDIRDAFETRPVQHYKALGIDEMGGLLLKLDDYEGDASTALGLRLMALMFPRPGELRLAEWSEFDLRAATWSVPEARMKMRRPHLVPLARQSIAALKALQKVTGRTAGLLFPNVKDDRRPASENTFLFALYRLGFHSRATTHGFRATASTYLNESGKFRPDVIERQLAHVEADSSRRPYNRALYWPERVAMMQHWADALDEAKASAEKAARRRDSARRRA